MIYFMSKRMYWHYINGKDPMTHEELIAYINWAFGLMGTVVELHILAN